MDDEARAVIDPLQGPFRPLSASIIFEDSKYRTEGFLRSTKKRRPQPCRRESLGEGEDPPTCCPFGGRLARHTPAPAAAKPARRAGDGSVAAVPVRSGPACDARPASQPGPALSTRPEGVREWFGRCPVLSKEFQTQATAQLWPAESLIMYGFINHHSQEEIKQHAHRHRRPLSV